MYTPRDRHPAGTSRHHADTMLPVHLPGVPIPSPAARRGYSLLQVVAAVAIIAVLMAVAMKSYSIAHSGAMASLCAARMKTLAMELERYRADRRCYPNILDELYPEYVTTEEGFRCPEDTRPGVRTYTDFYIVRSEADKDEQRLLLCCPFHQESGKGVQVFLNNPSHHERGRTYVATLSGGGGVLVLPYDVERPGEAEPTEEQFWQNAQASVPGQEVCPGDWILVTQGTVATLSFHDGSSAEIAGPSQVMVVDAFQYTSGRELSPFFTILRLASGYAYHIVQPGSRYEVITPTGTAGAKGTRFWSIYAKGPDGAPLPPPKGKSKWKNKPKGTATASVTEGVIYLTGRFGTIDVYAGEEAEVTEDGSPRKRKKRDG